jgi:hypothetical protein
MAPKEAKMAWMTLVMDKEEKAMNSGVMRVKKVMMEAAVSPAKRRATAKKARRKERKESAGMILEDSAPRS